MQIQAKDNKRLNRIGSKELRVREYGKYYSENDFWNKIMCIAKKAGIKVTYIALVLYYALEYMPIGKKAVIAGALGYFILPADVIPDFIAFLGFTDDASVLVMVYNICKDIIDEKVKKQAKSKLSEWFGEFDDKKLQ